MVEEWVMNIVKKAFKWPFTATDNTLLQFVLFCGVVLFSPLLITIALLQFM